MSNYKFDAEEVKNAMRGQWVDFLSQCAGFDARVFNKKHQACPMCGGKDRFRFDDNLEFRGDGGYLCGQCGSGSGMKLYLESTRVGFGTALEDCANFLNMQPIERKTYNSNRAHVVLPMKLDPHQEAEAFYNSCDEMNGARFVKGAQVIKVTDASNKMISCALLSGVGQPIKYFNKKMIWGSCVIFGKLEGKVLLTSDYYQAERIHRKKGINTVCFFDSHNLYFIHKEIKKLNVTLAIVCHSEEDWLQADKCQFINGLDAKGQQFNVDTMCGFVDGFDAKLM
jgi:hypothetical protein